MTSYTFVRRSKVLLSVERMVVGLVDVEFAIYSEIHMSASATQHGYYRQALLAHGVLVGVEILENVALMHPESYFASTPHVYLVPLAGAQDE